MKITEENFNNLDLFIKDNLCEFNKSQKAFEYNKLSKKWPKEFGDVVISATDIRKKLNENYKSLLDNQSLKNSFEEKLSNMTSKMFSVKYKYRKVQKQNVGNCTYKM